MKLLDLNGQRFGRLIVLRRDNAAIGKVKWRCICDCGKTCIARAEYLRSGHTRSCGCIRAEGNNNRQHGRSQTTEYRIWCGIKRRCYNANEKAYPLYGGRGIVMCTRWRDSFANFYADMGPRPSGLTIERKNNNGNYTPKNCVWADWSTQMKNRRSWRKR